MDISSNRLPTASDSVLNPISEVIDRSSPTVIVESQEVLSQELMSQDIGSQVRQEIAISRSSSSDEDLEGLLLAFKDQFKSNRKAKKRSKKV